MLAKQVLPSRLKTFHVGDFFQKTMLVSGPVQISLWNINDTFHMAFFPGYW